MCRARCSNQRTSAAKTVKPTRAMSMGPARLRAKLVVCSSANNLKIHQAIFEFAPTIIKACNAAMPAGEWMPPRPLVVSGDLMPGTSGPERGCTAVLAEAYGYAC